MGAFAALLIQAMLISGLLYERHRRHLAEIDARERMSELAYMNRRGVASGMSAALAHELNQPLGAILNNAETAEIILNSRNPNLQQLKTLLADIRNDDWRATEIIRRLRSLFSKTPTEFRSLDFNQIVRDALAIVSAQARNYEVAIHQNLAAGTLPIQGDPVQLQQVVMNLAMNSVEAMNGVKAHKHIVAQTTIFDHAIEFSISDSGPGIAPDDLAEIFEPFFTTKPSGMGLGLSLARTIIETHGGKFWAHDGPTGGAVFRFRIPSTRRDDTS
jgi:signal transduction histidine kinase